MRNKTIFHAQNHYKKHLKYFSSVIHDCISYSTIHYLTKKTFNHIYISLPMYDFEIIIRNTEDKGDD